MQPSPAMSVGGAVSGYDGNGVNGKLKHTEMG